MKIKDLRKVEQGFNEIKPITPYRYFENNLYNTHG